MTATTTETTSAGTTGQDAAKPGAVPSFTVTLKISRYNPETDSEPHWETYQVTSHATDRVLDALQSDELCACNWRKGDPTIDAGELLTASV